MAVIHTLNAEVGWQGISSVRQCWGGGGGYETLLGSSLLTAEGPIPYGPVLPLTDNKNTDEDRLASSHVWVKYLTRLSSLNIRSDVFCFVLEC